MATAISELKRGIDGSPLQILTDSLESIKQESFFFNYVYFNCMKPFLVSHIKSEVLVLKTEIESFLCM